MRMDVLVALTDDDGEGGRQLGAAVVRPHPGGGVAVDLGPADGPPLVRFLFATAEASRLAAALQNVTGGRGEEIVMAED